MGRLKLEKDRLIFQRRDELVVIEAYGKNCLRCRMTRNGRISDESPVGRALLEKKKGETVHVEVPVGVISYKIMSISK